MKTEAQISKIYKKRFFETGTEYRDKMWSVLCKNFFQKYFDKNDTVVDIPCGYCEFINNIEVKNKIAIDLNPESSKYANKEVVFLNSTSEKIPLNNKSVDKIFVSNFFEHLTRDQIVNTISEFKRILKKGGKVLVLQPNIRFCAKDYWMFFDHITPIDDRALDEVFSIKGFKLFEKIDKFLPYSTKSKLPKSLVFIKIYLKYRILWSVFGKQSILVYFK